MKIRRAAAVVVLTLASVFFATRFHGPTQAALRSDDVPEVRTVATTTTEPAALDESPTTTLPPTTTTSTSTTTTTIVIPDDIEGAEVFEGSRVYTNWGWVKVELSVLDGVMVDIEMVMIPRATKRSMALVAEHEPTLEHTVLTTQDPDVDVIAGATMLFEGYRASLIGAMKEAGLWPPPA